MSPLLEDILARVPDGRIAVRADLRIEGPGGSVEVRDDGGDLVADVTGRPAGASREAGPLAAAFVRATGQTVRVRVGGEDAVVLSPGRSLIGRLLRMPGVKVRVKSAGAVRRLLRG